MSIDDAMLDCCPKVIHNVFDDETCAKTVHGMWEVCEGLNPGLHRDDISTWNALKASGKYGLSSRGPCFHPQLVRNRQNPILIGVLELLIGSPVLVSQDRSPSPSMPNKEINSYIVLIII